MHCRGYGGPTLTYTHLTALCPGLPERAGTRKVKPIWMLLKRQTVGGSGIIWAIRKSAPCSRPITTPAPHHSVIFTVRMPFPPPNQQRRSTEGTVRGRTGLEADFADHEPLGVEMEVGADRAADPVRDRNDHVARELDQSVAHVLVDDRAALVVAGVAGTRDAEVQHRLAERTNILHTRTHAHTHTLGERSLASLRGRLIEYQLAGVRAGVSPLPGGR